MQVLNLGRLNNTWEKKLGIKVFLIIFVLIIVIDPYWLGTSVEVKQSELILQGMTNQEVDAAMAYYRFLLNPLVQYFVNFVGAILLGILVIFIATHWNRPKKKFSNVINKKFDKVRSNVNKKGKKRNTSNK